LQDEKKGGLILHGREPAFAGGEGQTDALPVESLTISIDFMAGAQYYRERCQIVPKGHQGTGKASS